MLFDDRRAGAQHEMEGVAEDDFGADGAQLLRVMALTVP